MTGLQARSPFVSNHLDAKGGWNCGIRTLKVGALLQDQLLAVLDITRAVCWTMVMNTYFWTRSSDQPLQLQLVNLVTRPSLLSLLYVSRTRSYSVSRWIPKLSTHYYYVATSCLGLIFSHFNYCSFYLSVIRGPENWNTVHVALPQVWISTWLQTPQRIFALSDSLICLFLILSRWGTYIVSSVRLKSSNV